jgi:hypothetical protein
MLAHSLMQAAQYLQHDGFNMKVNSKSREHYQKGLFFITYLLINTDNEISDNELVLLHKMRIEEGIDDATFAGFFNHILGKPEKEVYQIGIDALNHCSDEDKVRAFERLFEMAYADKLLKPREVRFILYAIKLTNSSFEHILNLAEAKPMLA